MFAGKEAAELMLETQQELRDKGIAGKIVKRKTGFRLYYPAKLIGENRFANPS